jgi:thiamine biosynthesis lipoprotein ApbE
MYVTHKEGEPVEVYLQHPINQDEIIGSIAIKNKSLCCSSSYIRMWEKDNKKQNHFISSNGNEIWAASYVVGDIATSADIAATVLCLASKNEQHMETLSKNFNVDYLVYDDAFIPFGNLAYSTVTE